MSAHQFENYNELVLTIERWLARSDLTDDVKGFIWLAECDIQRTVKFRLSDAIAQGSTIPGDAYITLPSDYVEGGLIRWSSDDSLPTLEIGSLDMTLAARTAAYSSGHDLRLGSVFGDRVYVGPSAQAAVDYDLFYKAGVNHLGSTNQSNLILKQYPDCLLFGSLICAGVFLRDAELIGTNAPLYENAKEETRRAEERARYGPGTLRMRPDVTVY